MGFFQLLIVLIIVLIVFGDSKLIKTINDIRNGLRNVGNNFEKSNSSQDSGDIIEGEIVQKKEEKIDTKGNNKK